MSPAQAASDPRTAPPSYPRVRRASATASTRRLTDPLTRMTPSLALAIESIARVSQLTRRESSGLLPLATESVMLVFESVKRASQLTRIQSSTCRRASKHQPTPVESITTLVQGRGEVGGRSR